MGARARRRRSEEDQGAGHAALELEVLNAVDLFQAEELLKHCLQGFRAGLTVHTVMEQLVSAHKRGTDSTAVRSRRGITDKDLMVGVCREGANVRFARCCSSRFALASSAYPGVVGGGAEGKQREARETMELPKTRLALVDAWAKSEKQRIQMRPRRGCCGCRRAGARSRRHHAPSHHVAACG